MSVRATGARGDGKTLDTAAIQAAIDAAGRSGGTVVFPPGEYVSGTLRLRDRIVLRLERGAVLVASPDDDDFDPLDIRDDSAEDHETADFSFALLRGHGLEQVSIVGRGRIDGNRAVRRGPKPIALKECRRITIRDLTIENAGNYNVSLLGCEDIQITGLTIANGYSDGIDPDACRNVRISGCRIESRDDAIVAKVSEALDGRRAMENLVVEHCTIVNARNALKLGTESTGDFRSVVFRDCTISGRKEPWLALQAWKPFPSAGISLTTVDGGTLENVAVSNIKMTGIRAPIFVRLGNRRGRGTGALRNVSISNIEATGARWPSSITGLPGSRVADVTLRNVRISTGGGADDKSMQREVPEREQDYPDATRFRDLPASGLYCRHVTGLRLERFDLTVEHPDARPAVTLDGVREATVRQVIANAPSNGGPVVWLRAVRGAVLDRIQARAAGAARLRISGAGSNRIELVEGDAKPPEHLVTLDADVDTTALKRTRRT